MHARVAQQESVNGSSRATVVDVEQGARARRLPGSTAATALVVSAAYLVGARIGFALVFPPSTPSVLWPPNSILTVALLLTPVRRWWICLLAALPAHIVIELTAGLPPALVLALFVTNCSEAVLAAAGVRAFSDVPARFDTLRRVAIFIGAAALFAPFVSSFLDAGVVTLLRGEPYWHVWQTRFFSNVLTELTLVPAVVSVIVAGPAWIRFASPARRAEATLFAVALLVTGLIAFAGPSDGPWAIPGSPRTPVAFLLPFLLWAAVRFGPGGTSLSLLATAVIVIGAGMHGRGPFSDLPPAQSVLALQVFLIALGIPFLALAAVVDERRLTGEELRERLAFERLLSRLSAAFGHMSSDAVHGSFETGLRLIGEFFGMDAMVAFELSADRRQLATLHVWTSSGHDVGQEAILRQDVPRLVERLRKGTPTLLSGPQGWLLVIPLIAGGRLLGGLGFLSVTDRSWHVDRVHCCRVAAEVLATALARTDAEDALRASEVTKSAILNSLTDSVAVLDRQGRIIVVNDAWSRFARAHGADLAAVGVGVSYLEACAKAAERGDAFAAAARAGIEAVLDGSRTRFGHEYVCRAGQESWWFVSAEPLSRPAGGAVVSHTDITERKRAEIEAQRSREELAHFARMSTMGELTASLAHELNQPLTGIMANSQAARRLVDGPASGKHELRQALLEIVEDTRRASEVIHRVRELVRKSPPAVVALDINSLIRDVTRLLGSDAVLRNVTVELDVPSGPLTVDGDHVQLRQAVLNLVLNALEAVSESAIAGRHVRVRTARTEEEAVLVTVQDAGPGLREGTEERVFEPFYTTKPGGMGMGLSIAKSIIEAHGGIIWARNNRGAAGATFQFTLPSARAKA